MVGAVETGAVPGTSEPEGERIMGIEVTEIRLQKSFAESDELDRLLARLSLGFAVEVSLKESLERLASPLRRKKLANR